jgi:peptidoglycan/xylan/chitin deacetylase (PgdA/CDA1 family)
MKTVFIGLSILAVAFFIAASPNAGETRTVIGAEPAGLNVPILLYHRFGPLVADGMTVTTSVFQSHLEYLKENGYIVVPLRLLVEYYLGKGPKPPPKAVVLVADDGHESVYQYMLPLVREYRVSVTLFLYPSAISNASYALTWDQLRELKKTGLFDFQGHTYWHPNFKRDEKRMSRAEYEESVALQLNKSRAKLEKELGVRIDMLAWPFGFYNDWLIGKAKEAGYVAAFSIEARHAIEGDAIMKLPRYLLVDSHSGTVFEKLVQGKTTGRNLR